MGAHWRVQSSPSERSFTSGNCTLGNRRRLVIAAAGVTTDWVAQVGLRTQNPPIPKMSVMRCA
jgi:hypothetical protein